MRDSRPARAVPGRRTAGRLWSQAVDSDPVEPKRLVGPESGPVEVHRGLFSQLSTTDSPFRHNCPVSSWVGRVSPGLWGGTEHNMRGRRGRNERGAVAVEAALVTPLLFVMLFGIIEMSLLMRDVVSASSSVRAGARTGSALAAAGPCNTACTPTTAPALAQSTASAIERAGSALPEDAMQWLMVYEDNGNGYPIGQTALASSTGAALCSSNCVVYTW